MVDVGAKEPSERVAVARAVVRMRPETLRRLREGDVPKADVLATARIAGIQAAKRTSELIPLCHQIALGSVEVTFELADDHLAIETRASARDRTGVEMEALAAASVAALTIYDMLKSIERGMTIESVALQQKSGGRSGHWHRD